MAGQDDSKTSPTKSYAQAASEGVGSSENPPPPYTPQHGQSASTPAAPQPHRQQYQPRAQHAQRSQQPLLRPPPSGGSVVVVVPHQAIAVARARRRFFGALFWAIIIYLVAGVLFGDWELENRRNRHKHRHPRDRDWLDVKTDSESPLMAVEVPGMEVESAALGSDPATTYVPIAAEAEDKAPAAVDFIPFV